MPDGPGDRTAASPAAFPDSPLSRVLRQPLILGLFLPVQSGGWSASLLPRTTDWRFDYNAALTKGPYSNYDCDSVSEGLNDFIDLGAMA
jgi:hypothetical protein